MRPLSKLPVIRGRDNHGAGYYGASRGSRDHVGIDIVIASGDEVKAFQGGTVTKLGYPYASGFGGADSGGFKYRYVEVHTDDKQFCRYFYVSPCVHIGQKIHAGEIIGISQPIADRYPGMTPHCHFEVFGKDGSKRVYVDPVKWLSGDA